MPGIALFAKFPLGDVAVTALAASRIPARAIMGAVIRHATADWGTLDPNEGRRNEIALEYGFFVVSRHRTSTGLEFVVVTENDRTLTTVALPQEWDERRRDLADQSDAGFLNRLPI